MRYILEEQKFIRERYILVAAIATMTMQGFWSSCVVKGRKKSINITLRSKQELTRLRGTGSLIRIELNQRLSVMDSRE
jgi:hypothetical protein